MEIVINYNDDTLSIDGVVLYEKLHNPSQITAILEEVFNRMHPDAFIELQTINEDQRRTVGEW